MAERTVLFDHEINRLEVEIDQGCLGVLALRQPTARDLRFVTLALKVVTDLERVGDQCVNICSRVLELNQEPPLNSYKFLLQMAQISSRRRWALLYAAMRALLSKSVKTVSTPL